MGWGWIPPRSTNQVGREFPHIQAEGMSRLLALDHLVVSNHPQQQAMCVCMDPGSWNGLSHLSSALGWNTNKGDSLLANHSVGAQGIPGCTELQLQLSGSPRPLDRDRHPPQPPEPRAALQNGFENLGRGYLRQGDLEHRGKEGPPRDQDDGRRLFQEAGCLKCSSRSGAGKTTCLQLR